MIDKDTTETPQAVPAVGAQVDRVVRPAAWVRDLGPQPHCVTDLRYCAASDVERGIHLQYLPLYDQAAIDAAVAAERERVRVAIDAFPHWIGPKAKNELLSYLYGPNVEVTCPPRAGHRSNDE